MGEAFEDWLTTARPLQSREGDEYATLNKGGLYQGGSLGPSQQVAAHLLDLELVPNAVDAELQLDFTLKKGGVLQWEVFSNQGEVVYRSSDQHKPPRAFSARLSTAGLPAGVFWLRTTLNGQASLSQRLIIHH